MSSLVQRLESYFEFERLGTNWRTEILAGATTFLTMAYIVFVNPSILAAAGVPYTGAVAATCFSAACASLLMGVFARYPIAMAPGMGLNAYFTYTVVLGMGVSWQAALGAVFISGLAFLILTVVGVRQLIVAAIPSGLYAAVAAGIGLFIAVIGFRNAGIIAPAESTLVKLGNLRDPRTLLALFCLLLICGLLAWRVRAAMLLGILGASLLAFLTGVVQWRPAPYRWSEITSTAFKLDLAGILLAVFVEVVFLFLFVALFDNIGTLVAVGKRAGLFEEGTRIPRLQRILISDGAATTLGSLAGTSTVVSYIESAAGVAAGGRTGVTAAVTGLLFAAALFFAPLLGALPAAATAPALIVVGFLMMTTVAEVHWGDPVLGPAAFLTMLAIPLTFSIANGLAFGFVAYTLLRIVRGEFRSINWLMYLLATLCILRFVYLGQAG